MTPLAQQLMRELAKPIDRQQVRLGGAWSRDNLFDHLCVAHCFELSEVAEIIPTTGYAMLGKTDDGRDFDGTVESKFAFLPAPSVWFEYRAREGGSHARNLRWGYAMFAMSSDEVLFGIFAGQGGKFFSVCDGTFGLAGTSKAGSAGVVGESHLAEVFPDRLVGHLCLDVFPILAIINSPRVVGRVRHRTHAGLHRDLIKPRRPDATPHDWNEIKLRVTPPDLSAEEASDGGFTFTKGKALHFCRSHLRLQHGKLVVVSAHWRGDPELGIRQRHYTVAP